MSKNKSEEMQLVQVVELLRQGNIEKLIDIPQEIVKKAASVLAKGAMRKLGVKVYEASGAIGITGIRTRPVVLYGGEWDTVGEFMQTDAFKSARSHPLASTGSDDPRYAKYRDAAKAKRDVERKARDAQ